MPPKIKKIKIDPNKTIDIPVGWLKQLTELTKKVEKDIDKWYQTDKPLMPLSISCLVGFASSAETLLKLKK